MRLEILGTGVVGKTIAACLAGLGHDVMVGTRDPQETLSRTERSNTGNPVPPPNATTLRSSCPPMGFSISPTDSNRC